LKKSNCKCFHKKYQKNISNSLHVLGEKEALEEYRAYLSESPESLAGSVKEFEKKRKRKEKASVTIVLLSIFHFIICHFSPSPQMLTRPFSLFMGKSKNRGRPKLDSQTQWPPSSALPLRISLLLQNQIPVLR
jgi:hypothetical protein